MYRAFFLPVLKRFDPEVVHERTLTLLSLGQRLAPGRRYLRLLAGRIPARPVEAFGLTFPNVLGVAAGFDKDVRVTHGLFCLGFGHVEVGTLTPRPQAGNPHPRLFRLPADGALINRLGFPNAGVVAAVPRLARLAARRDRGVIGVSLGKQKETALGEAAVDYSAVMQAVYAHADYLAVNVSSPNTPGLRELQGGRYLDHLLAELAAENKRLSAVHERPPRPLLLKIAPDLTWPELDQILTAAQDNQIDGIIATNTTLSRVGLAGAWAAETGGLSGRPLAQRSTEIIDYISRQTGGALPVIGVGGVFTAADVQAKLDAGAILVQLYTGLIYEGPAMAGRILRDLTYR
jgi:dihydroorotate dehydrogenase